MYAGWLLLQGFRCKERKSTVICAISAPSPHFAAGTFVAEEYQPEEKQSILELVANLAMKPASPDKASDPSELQFSSSSDQGQSTDQGEQGMDQAESNDAIIVATDIPWKILKAALRASLKREKFQEQNSRGGGAKRRGRASSSGQDEKNCFVQRQPPFCVVELCVDNHHAPISDSPNVCNAFVEHGCARLLSPVVARMIGFHSIQAATLIETIFLVPIENLRRGEMCVSLGYRINGS